jgi:spermidine synthase
MPSRKFVVLAILVKGFSSIIVQTILIRELLIVFYGNELTFGVILSTWLLSGAIGASLIANSFRGEPIRAACFLQFFLSVAAPLALTLIRASKALLHIPFGEAFQLGHIVGITAGAIAFVAMADGAMFNIGFRLVSLTKEEGGSSVAKLYLWESLGLIAGGITFTFILLSLLNPFAIILLVSTINLLCANLLLLKEKNRLIRALFGGLLLASICLWFSSQEFQDATLRLQWQKKNMVANKNSVYGNIAALREQNQYTIFYDGIPAVSIPSPETYFTEDFIHLPLLTKPKAKNVLFIGTAIGGLLKETLKYPITKAVYVEMDPVFIEVVRSLHDPATEEELNSPKVHIAYTDGRDFLKNTQDKFDVVFVNTGLPTSLGINRYYTKEFFQEVKSALADGGIAVFKTWGSLAYLTNELRHVNAVVLKTLSGVFPEIRTIPGDGFNMFIASKTAQDLNPYTMAMHLRQYGIQTYLINQGYLQLRLQKPYLDWFLNNIGDELKKIDTNEDLKPTGLYEGLSLYYAQFSKKIPKLFGGFKKIGPKTLLLNIFVFFFIWRLILSRSRTNLLSFDFTILTTGLYGMAIQIIALFLFQSLLGYLFAWLAVLTTSFMAGTSLGALYANSNIKKFRDIKKLAAIEAALPILTTVLSLTIILIFKYNLLPTAVTKWLFSLISVCAGLLVGLELPIVFELALKTTNPWRRESSKIAGLYYCLDLTGACAGAILTPLVLIPSCGIVTTILILLAIKITNARFLFSISQQ